MTNSTLELIHKHASVRRYKPDPVPIPIIETIVQATQRASTSSNLQTYSVIAVTDATKREKLAALADNQPFICDAPAFLVWCADLARLDRVCQLRGTIQVTEYVDNFLTAAMDAALAAQNAALAAESLGLGMCYVGALRNNSRGVIELLGLPRLVFPLFGMTLGWPAKEARVKPRLPLQAILHWEKYNSDQDAVLHEYDQTMAATGIYTGRQAPFPGREGEMENYGWLEHSARRAARAARTNLREVLEEQGFLLK
ncbi:MAG: nitroreductase family protein [Chloroflexota bacterium]